MRALLQAGPTGLSLRGSGRGRLLHSALLLARREPRVRVIAGINLPMLLEFLHRRGRVSVEELSEQILQRRSRRDAVTGAASYLWFRVDDRLLHGQVTLGWGRHLDPDVYLLADA
ncbi:MAG: PTS sugar transporter subunit IIB [Candidatus Eisenbacteria bacterium]